MDNNLFDDFVLSFIKETFMDNNLFVILDDFVLSFIIEPNKKVYYVAETDKLICCVNKLSAHRYVNKLAAQSIVDHLKTKFNLDFSIEKL